MKLLAVIIFLIPTLATAFRFHQRPNIFICHKRGINCVNDNTFVFCRGFFQHILVDKYSFQCPEGYVCSSDSKYTCIKDPDSESDESNEIITTQSDVFTTKNTDHSSTEESDERGSTHFAETTTLTTLVTESAENEDKETTTYSPDSSEENKINDQSEESDSDETIDDNDQNINIEPTCTKVDETFPGPTCSKYYKCHSLLIWTFPVLQMCEDGQSFDTATSSCVPSSESNCSD
ncbi:hypothetical protein TcasGA2_TC004478 [Tribolium castaneum]|uniref:Chitin-binding type-2 domain-containing protein n=1 Tax=Tribolium castaneum TaxID=7070 RepID=D6WCI5_TRICA|nr:PREDICTED: uncharacterized protein LOC661087 [Tribolium castaneum]EEZ98866.1 hypothetical protein TcasGA2_TC004478 [Tribolium castaneum]|eukprot:XP_976370.1 PREDICTED: uncharacterized protein LOC661087 [Tribolium castaneum]